MLSDSLLMYNGCRIYERRRKDAAAAGDAEIPSRRNDISLMSSPSPLTSRHCHHLPAKYFSARHPERELRSLCFVTPFNHRSASTPRSTMDFYVVVPSVNFIDSARAVCHVPETTTIFYHHTCDRVGCRSGYSFVSLIDVFLLLRLAIGAACASASTSASAIGRA